MTGAGAAEIERALGGVTEFFHQRQTRAGVVARRTLGISLSGDDQLTDQLIRERRRKTRLDGGIGGWVVATTWSALELMQLGCAPDHTGVDRMIGYLLARQDQPGRFGESCSPRRHEIGHCHHFTSGFFSSGTVDDPVAPVTFPNGTLIHDEWEARFAVSCYALRAALQARHERREAVRRHLDSLFHLIERWENQEFVAAPDLQFIVAAAVALAPLEDRDRTAMLVRHLAGAQQPDGTWERVWLFNALDAMLLAPWPEALEAARQAGPALVDRQQPSGAFDETDNEEIALIALRALWAHGSSRAIARAPRRTPASIPVPGR